MLRPIQPSSPATKELHGLWVAELEVISSLNSLPPESVLFFERRKMSSLDEKKNNEWTNSLTDWLARGQQLYSTYSVTRFGENSQLWQHFQIFGNFLRVWLVCGKLLNPPWKIQCAFGPIYFVENDQILTKHYRHLVTLYPTYSVTTDISPFPPSLSLNK